MIIDANNVLSNHWFDATYASQKKKQRENQQRQQHQQQQNDDKAPQLSFAQMEGKCYCCSKPGHKSPTCQHKGKLKSK